MTQTHDHWEHRIPFLGGIARFNLRKSGPRNYRVIGVLSYGDTAKIGFKADVEVRAMVKAGSVIPDAVASLLPGIIESLASAVVGVKKP